MSKDAWLDTTGHSGLVRVGVMGAPIAVAFEVPPCLIGTGRAALLVVRSSPDYGGRKAQEGYQGSKHDGNA